MEKDRLVIDVERVIVWSRALNRVSVILAYIEEIEALKDREYCEEVIKELRYRLSGWEKNKLRMMREDLGLKLW